MLCTAAESDSRHNILLREDDESWKLKNHPEIALWRQYTENTPFNRTSKLR